MAEQRDEFLRLFLRHEADLKAFIGALVRERSTRDDVFQDVALILWQRFDEYDAARSFGAWARGIAAKKVLQQKDQDARFPVAFSAAAIEAVLAVYDRTEPFAARRMEALEECLEQLPEKSRKVLEWRYQDQLKPAEIAERTGRTQDAVYQALSRIRALLEDCIRRQLAVEEGGA